MKNIAIVKLLLSLTIIIGITIATAFNVYIAPVDKPTIKNTQVVNKAYDRPNYKNVISNRNTNQMSDVLSSKRKSINN